MISHKPIHNHTPASRITYIIGRIWLRIIGWDVQGTVPSERKFIIIGSPHTSNWDFTHGIAGIYVFRLKITWIGKKSLFSWPYGWFMRWMGGVPIDRTDPKDMVHNMVSTLNEKDEWILVLAPSGTRSKTEYWKSGFYRIALNANVPIVCGYLDYNRKVVGLGIQITPSGDIVKDMEKIRSFYKEIRGKYPELESEVRLRNED